MLSFLIEEGLVTEELAALLLSWNHHISIGTPPEVTVLTLKASKPNQVGITAN